MRVRPGTIVKGLCGTALLFLSGCNRHQSALSPFGDDAARIQVMTVVLVAGAVVIGIAVAALMVWAVRLPANRLTLVGGERFILIAGGIVPSAVLLALLIYSLPAMRPRDVSPGDLNVAVTGEQFWWRVRYEPPGATPLTDANEIRIPVGRTVRLRLLGGDVIHSFWIPGLAGKVDMIPGRENTLVVRATRPGVFRGQCTEFCGLSHALMAFDVVAMPPEAFDAWLAGQQAAPARAAAPGQALFAQHGCGGCHTIRGTEHAGTIGPDLTRMGARRSLGAGTLPPSEANIASFIRHPEHHKPGVRMPAFPHMPEREAMAIARYLKALR
ncbi:cytochrome c oxidase subunit 2 [Novosphingobium chloroacetimidivorans]|uniref:Cytochrome aa3 subunit 2 n=1 Tax=Novosphingobium chloroacetimidivorans TaxID=1428314 RepID=A0A7W7K8Q7_9SPHN|nr:cytochrome c oxidase subunit II [Novosphingobium chloroacetimidivorans]MBB4858344.1 cytochrome c oxidase subunit 2 [Novosphingobium chloroacetimidivorans]